MDARHLVFEFNHQLAPPPGNPRRVVIAKGGTYVDDVDNIYRCDALGRAPGSKQGG